MTLPSALTATGLRVAFDGVEALAGVDLTVPAGRITAIVGPNGAGKSTLLEVLAGARTPSAGRVEAGARSRAFVPQRAAVSEHLPVTVREIVSLGAWGRIGAIRRLRPALRDDIDVAMRQLDITALARTPFGSLSGGQRQRVLAQGLARRADVLLLDEPTTGLDAASAELNRRAIAAEIARGATVVCVSHDDRLIAQADQVITLADGRVRRASAPAR
ncbi:metal ABC transporter ATP-binding protein [Microbacterium testaceum]|uniref:metal ABC transporter ATP-binding protein n=1 Tax=Microbacterium testaceum TaxID=2033 RepID=UPI0022E50DFA|nr:metal ABC transporter ATP-binding protein [Microbacterium testaceum]